MTVVDVCSEYCAAGRVSAINHNALELEKMMNMIFKKTINLPIESNTPRYRQCE